MFLEGFVDDNINPTHPKRGNGKQSIKEKHAKKGLNEKVELKDSEIKGHAHISSTKDSIATFDKKISVTDKNSKYKNKEEKLSRIIFQSDCTDSGSEKEFDLASYKKKFISDTKQTEKQRRDDLMKNRKTPPEKRKLNKKTDNYDDACNARPFKEKGLMHQEQESDISANESFGSLPDIQNILIAGKIKIKPQNTQVSQKKIAGKYVKNETSSSSVNDDLQISKNCDSWEGRRDGYMQIEKSSCNRTAADVRARLLQSKMESIFGVDNDPDDLPLSPDSYCSSVSSFKQTSSGNTTPINMSADVPVECGKNSMTNFNKQTQHHIFNTSSSSLQNLIEQDKSVKSSRSSLCHKSVNKVKKVNNRKHDEKLPKTARQSSSNKCTKVRFNSKSDKVSCKPSAAGKTLNEMKSKLSLELENLPEFDSKEALCMFQAMCSNREKITHKEFLEAVNGSKYCKCEIRFVFKRFFTFICI